MSKFWSPWKNSYELLTLSQEQQLFPHLESARVEKPSLPISTLVVSGLRSGLSPEGISQSTVLSEGEVLSAYTWLWQTIQNSQPTDETLQKIAVELDALYDSGNKHAGNLLLAAGGPTFNKNFTPTRVALVGSYFLLGLYPSATRVRHY